MLRMEAANGASVEQLLNSLKSVCGEVLADTSVEHGDLLVRVTPDNQLNVLRSCKESAALDFAMLIDITAVDWLDSRAERFEVVYQLLSLSKNWRLTVKVPLAENKPEISSVTSLWHGASFLEREVWDMFGILFKGHADLRRILLYEEFVGHPLRKDYPVQGKQPRIQLRHPEVENTARLMHRGDLVTIRTRREVKSGAQPTEGQQV